MKNLITLSLVVTLIAGCASSSRLAKQSHFEPVIYPSGTKAFTFTLADKESKIKAYKKEMVETGVGGSARAEDYDYRGDPSLSRNKAKMPIYQQAKNLLDKQLNLTEFCRNGFIETDSYFFEKSGFIKGRCKDKATKQDLVKFSQAVLVPASGHESGGIESTPIYR